MITQHNNNSLPPFIFYDPPPQKSPMWCPEPQSENYCLSGEPCYPNTNLSSGSLLLSYLTVSHCYLFVTGQHVISKAIRNPVTSVSGLTCSY